MLRIRSKDLILTFIASASRRAAMGVTLIGLFVAGSIILTGLGVASLFGAGLFQTLSTRAS